MSNHRSNQHQSGCKAVADAVGGGSLNCRGLDLASDRAVVVCHIKLHENCQQQDHEGEERPLRQLRVQDLPKGSAQQFKAHEQNNHGDDQSGNILHAPVPEGMSGIRLLTGKTKSDEGDQGRTGIRQVIKSVRENRDGAGKQSDQCFRCKQ